MPRKKKVSDEEILRIARECFDRHGFDISLNLIAEKLGVSSTVLFLRYGTKENLFFESMLPDRLNAMFFFDQLRFIPEGRDVVDQVRDIITHLFNLAIEIHIVTEKFSRSNIALSNVNDLLEIPAPAPVVKAISKWCKAAIKEGAIAPLDPDFITDFLRSSTYSLTGIIFSRENPVTVEDYTFLVDQLTVLAWRSLDASVHHPQDPVWSDKAKIEINPCRPSLGETAARSEATFETLREATRIYEQRFGEGEPIHGTIMFDFGEDGVIVVRSAETGNIVDNIRCEADCTIKMSFEDFCRIESGKTTVARIRGGLINVSGDTSLAMKLYDMRAS